MEKERTSHKQTPHETNFFCEVLADLVNNFTGTLQRGALKRYSVGKYFIPLLLNLNKIFSPTKKSQKTLKEERKKPNCWQKSKRFLEKHCNMELKVQR